MRELTDRELDAVCGGSFSFSANQTINNIQNNNVHRGAEHWLVESCRATTRL